MSIISEPFYACRCDNCGKLATDGEDHEFFPNSDSAEEYAMESDWKQIDGKDICDLCYTIGEDDAVTINEFKP